MSTLIDRYRRRGLALAATLAACVLLAGAAAPAQAQWDPDEHVSVYFLGEGDPPYWKYGNAYAGGFGFGGSGGASGFADSGGPYSWAAVSADLAISRTYTKNGNPPNLIVTLAGSVTGSVSASAEGMEGFGDAVASSTLEPDQGQFPNHIQIVQSAHATQPGGEPSDSYSHTSAQAYPQLSHRQTTLDVTTTVIITVCVHADIAEMGTTEAHAQANAGATLTHEEAE